jgi:tetratricopeptide (TPR) repeat protein
MGVQLQRQIEQLRDAGRTSEIAELAAAFVPLLERIADSPGGDDWTTRHWAAQSFFQLGQGGQAGVAADKRTAAQREWLTRSRDLYTALLKAEADGKVKPPSEAAVTAARYQLGECYQSLGQYQEALDAYSGVLAANEAYLSVQRAAAYAYQQRGQAEGPEWLERAIHGGYQVRATGENRIWGWLKLSQAAERSARTNPGFWDTFFEARLNLARCRYQIAMELQGAERQQNLAQARQSVQSVVRLYPELGGPERKAEFEKLLQQIDAAAGTRSASRNSFP